MMNELLSKVSSRDMQSGNQVDYLNAEASLSSGTSAESEPELVPAADSPVPLRKPLRKCRHARRLVGSRLRHSGNSDEESQRPGAPHNTSQYLVHDFCLESPYENIEGEGCTAELIRGSMIGLFSSADFADAEKRLDSGKGAALVEDAGKSTSDPSIMFNREPELSAEQPLAAADGLKDTVGILLHEIKLRDKQIERLETVLQSKGNDS